MVAVTHLSPELLGFLVVVFALAIVAAIVAVIFW